MAPFFEARLSDYEEHMLCAIEGAREFYPFTADCLPKTAEARVLDLGCGTGLELDSYFLRNPSANVTAIDLSSGMLEVLAKKYPNRITDGTLKLVQGSYFDLPFGEKAFNAALSVESLHHFTKAEKTALYCKLWHALDENGYFILTDYFAQDDAQEAFFRAELHRLKQEEGIKDDAFYHYDTPLTVAHEIEALKDGGFSAVTVLDHWNATYALKATK